MAKYGKKGNSGTLVALRKESVDRNSTPQAVGSYAPVALRKESVDRNTIQARAGHAILSLSARRAWIEISYPTSGPWLAQRRSPQGERG